MVKATGTGGGLPRAAGRAGRSGTAERGLARAALAGAGRTLLLAGALLLLAAPEAWACPGCIEASSPSVQRGFLWSTVMLMATPYLVIGIIGGGLFYAYRRSVREEVERFIRESRDAHPSEPEPPAAR